VRDPEGLGALLRMPVVVRPVNDPPRRVGPDISWTVNGGVRASINVTGSFVDVDGDALTFLVSSGADLSFEVVGHVIIVEGLVPYQFSYVEINATAMDPEGATSDPLGITVEVREMQDPHTITAWSSEYTLIWGRGRYFTEFSVEDPDPGHYEYNVVLSVGNWSEQYKYRRTTNGWLWASPRPYWAPEWGSEEGDVVVTLGMYDNWYNASVSWVVHVRAENQPPEIRRIIAEPEGPYWWEQEVSFSAEVFDGDGDEVHYRWYLDGEWVSDGPAFTLSLDTTGEQKLVLEAYDEFNTTEGELRFLVVRDEESLEPPVGTLALLGGVAVAIIVASIYMIVRSRR
jgi:hypothetical protein